MKSEVWQDINKRAIISKTSLYRFHQSLIFSIFLLFLKNWTYIFDYVVELLFDLNDLKEVCSNCRIVKVVVHYHCQRLHVADPQSEVTMKFEPSFIRRRRWDFLSYRIPNLKTTTTGVANACFVSCFSIFIKFNYNFFIILNQAKT